MREIAPVGLAVVGTLVLLLAVTPQSSAIDPRTPWSVQALAIQAPQGPNQTFLIIGPQNTGFVLSVNAPPWNWSVPIFEVGGNTSHTVNNTTAQGQAVVRMPTVPFAQQEYQATLTVQGVAVSRSYFFIVPLYNTSILETEIEELQLELQGDELQLSHARSEISSLQVQGPALFGVVIGALVAFSCVVLYSTYGPRVYSRLHRFWLLVRSAFKRNDPPGFTPTADGPVPKAIEQLIPQHLWRADYCRECRGTRWTESMLRAHLLVAHPDAVGPDGPIRGVHYHLDVDAARSEITRKRTTDELGTTARKKAATRRREITPLGEMFGDHE